MAKVHRAGSCKVPFLQAKGCFSRSHTWIVFIQFLITISSPFTPWSKLMCVEVHGTQGRGTSVDKKHQKRPLPLDTLSSRKDSLSSYLNSLCTQYCQKFCQFFSAPENDKNISETRWKSYNRKVETKTNQNIYNLFEMAAVDGDTLTKTLRPATDWFTNCVDRKVISCFVIAFLSSSTDLCDSVEAIDSSCAQRK